MHQRSTERENTQSTDSKTLTIKIEEINLHADIITLSAYVHTNYDEREQAMRTSEHNTIG